MTSRTRVSVVLATYNGVSYLGEQLASILEQSRPADEIVVVDDGSADGSVEMARRLLADGPADVTISVSPERLGPAANFGGGITKASGDVIVLCDQDDRWRPNKLARIEAVLRSGDAMAVFSDGSLIDGEGADQGRTLWEAASFTGRLRRTWDAGDHLGALLHTNVVTGATLAFRAGLRDLVLPIPGSAWHDYWIALLAASAGGIVAIPDLLIDYRLHGQNTMGLPPRGLRQRATRWLADPGPIRAEISRLEDVRERLLERGTAGDPPSRIEEKIRHLEHRQALPASRPARIVPVLKEAASGRYHRLASGPKSMAVDLARKS